MTKTSPRRINPLTLANKITLLRILLIPAIVIALHFHEMSWFHVLFIFTAFTDLLDGFIARLRGEQTRVGAFLDPMADKLLLTSVYLTLTTLGIIDVWVFVVVFSRDLLIVLGWGIIYILTRAAVIQPRILGKITTAVQMLAAFAFTLDFIEPIVKKTLLGAIVTLTIVSVVDYILVGEKKLGQWE
jgi:cardiolipin synthase